MWRHITHGQFSVFSILSFCRYVPYFHLNTIVVTLTNVIVISVFHALFWFTVTHGNFKDFCELFWFIFMYVINVVCTQAKHYIFCGSASDDKSQFHDVLRVPIFISGSNLFLQKTKVVDFPLFTMKQLTSFLTIALSFKTKILKTFSSCDMPFSIFMYSPILVVFSLSSNNRHLMINSPFPFLFIWTYLSTLLLWWTLMMNFNDSLSFRPRWWSQTVLIIYVVTDLK